MIICVTGKMAAGKNTISALYEKQGFLCIDADLIVHDILKESQDEIFSLFKKDAESANINIKNKDGSLNRRQLGKLIFSRHNLLEKQENLIHPKVVERIKKMVLDNQNVVINATVMYKTPELLQMCEKIVYVKSNFFKRLLRAKKRDKMPILQILSRFYAQRNLYKEYKKTGLKIEIIKN